MTQGLLRTAPSGAGPSRVGEEYVGSRLAPPTRSMNAVRTAIRQGPSSRTMSTSGAGALPAGAGRGLGAQRPVAALQGRPPSLRQRIASRVSTRPQCGTSLRRWRRKPMVGARPRGLGTAMHPSPTTCVPLRCHSCQPRARLSGLACPRVPQAGRHRGDPGRRQPGPAAMTCASPHPLTRSPAAAVRTKPGPPSAGGGPR